MKFDKVKMYGRYLSEFLLPDQIQILEKEVIKLFKEQNEAINNKPCCKSDSEQLCANCLCKPTKKLGFCNDCFDKIYPHA